MRWGQWRMCPGTLMVMRDASCVVSCTVDTGERRVPRPRDRIYRFSKKHDATKGKA